MRETPNHQTLGTGIWWTMDFPTCSPSETLPDTGNKICGGKRYAELEYQILKDFVLPLESLHISLQHTLSYWR